MSSNGPPSRSLTLVLLLGIVAALYLGQAIFVPLVLSVFITFLLAPWVARLQRLGLPRIPAVIVVVACVFIAVGTALAVAAGQLIDLSANLPEYRTQFRARIQSIAGPAGGLVERVSRSLGGLSDSLQSPPPNKDAAKPAGSEHDAPKSPKDETAVPVKVVERSTSPMEYLRDWFGPLISPLATAGVVTLFVVFMLIQREDLRNRILVLIGEGQLYDTTQAMDDAAARVSRYIRMQSLINASYGVAVAIGLLAIGLPNAILWGVVAARFARFVPYVGPVVAAVVPIALSLVVFSGWTQPVLTIALFIVLELVVNNVLEPWLYGSSTGVSPVGIIVSAFFWAWLWGGLGLLLATPLTVCLVVLGRYVPQLRWFDIVLGQEPVLAPAARIYQRLLAYDMDEAAELAEEYLAAGSLETVYDQVLLPALCLAEKDRQHGDLESDRSRFVFESLKQLTSDLGDRIEPVDVAPVESDRPADAAHSPDELTLERFMVCVPAQNDADALAATMLAQVWRARGHRCEVTAVGTLVSELLDQVDRSEISVICISAIPPTALLPARHLCKRLRARFPEQRIAIGLWDSRTLREKAQQRLVAAGADKVCTSLADALAVLEPLAANQALLQHNLKQQEEPAKPSVDGR